MPGLPPDVEFSRCPAFPDVGIYCDCNPGRPGLHVSSRLVWLQEERRGCPA
jgi:hypothetical protein